MKGISSKAPSGVLLIQGPRGILEIRWITRNLYDLSKAYFAVTFLSSSPTCPARQSGLYQPTRTGGKLTAMGHGRIERGEIWPRCSGAFSCYNSFQGCV